MVDWFAYSSFALYFAPHFFPKGDSTAQLLQTAAIFAVGFFARPLGPEYAALWFKGEGMESRFHIYVSIILAVAFLVAARLRDTNKHTLIRED